jgi:hypothetical protein
VAPPLSVIDVTEHQSNVSSLGVQGVENLVEANSNKKAGHLKGSTRASADKENTRNEECKVEIAKAYLNKMNKMKAAGKGQVSRGYLTNLIRQKKTENSIPNTYYILERTIKNQIKRKRIDPPHPGVMSPIESSKEVLVQMWIMMGNVHQLLTTPMEGLQLMNSLIRSQGLQEKLIKFKH